MFLVEIDSFGCKNGFQIINPDLKLNLVVINPLNQCISAIDGALM